MRLVSTVQRRGTAAKAADAMIDEMINAQYFIFNPSLKYSIPSLLRVFEMSFHILHNLDDIPLGH